MDIAKLHEELELIYLKMVEIRRDLHMHPEISFQEERTPKVIAEYLKELDKNFRVVRNLQGLASMTALTTNFLKREKRFTLLPTISTLSMVVAKKTLFYGTTLFLPKGGFRL